MTRPLPFAIVLFCGLSLSAHAGDDAESAATEVVVPDSGGQYTIQVHKALITSLFFESEVESVWASDQTHYQIRRMGNAVAIRPLTDDAEQTGNVVVKAGELQVTVVMKTASAPSQADAQVTFRAAEVAEEIQRRVDREVSRRLASERAQIDRRIAEGIAERIYARFDTRRLRAIERNDDNVIVRVPQAIQVGADDVYLRWRLQNRSGETYRVTNVEVRAHGDDHAGAVVFDGKAARGPMLGQVPSGDSVDALVVVPGGARIDGDVTLVVTEASGRRAVRVGGIRLR